MVDAAHWLNFAWGPRLIYSGIFVHRLQMRRNLFFVCGACTLAVLDYIWWNLDSDVPCVISICGVSGVEQAWSSSLTKVSYATHVRMACGAFFKVRQWSSNSSKYSIASYLLSEIRRIFWISVDFWHLARFAPYLVQNRQLSPNTCFYLRITKVNIKAPILIHNIIKQVN